MPSATGQTAPQRNDDDAPTSYEPPYSYQDWPRNPWRGTAAGLWPA
jgi:hypothetical protein